jgi:hypothetical protein
MAMNTESYTRSEGPDMVIPAAYFLELDKPLYLIRSLTAACFGPKRSASLLITTMPSQEDLESVIRSVFNVTHLEIEDVSSGCGQSYSIVLVSPVRWLAFT